MSGLLSHQLRLSALRARPRTWPSYDQRRHLSMAEAGAHFLHLSNEVFTNVHQLAASPWYITIPLVAIITSATIRTPMTVWSISAAQARARLAPLVHAQTLITRRRIGSKGGSGVEISKSVSREMRRWTKGLYARAGANMSGPFWAALLSAPLFLSNVEALRKMCGRQDGLFSRLTFGRLDADDVVSTTASETIAFQPELADGGYLWFPNLLEADPYHILPFAVSIVMFLNMMPTSREGLRQLLGLSTPGQHTAQPKTLAAKVGMASERVLLLVTLSIGPLTMDLPAALHLYWFSSATTTLLITKGLKKAIKVPRNSFKPCTGHEAPVLRPQAPARLKGN